MFISNMPAIDIASDDESRLGEADKEANVSYMLWDVRG